MGRLLDACLEFITRDDRISRIARQGDMNETEHILRTKPVLIPLQPVRFHDLTGMSATDFSKALADDFKTINRAKEQGRVIPWIHEIKGIRRLPIFSSQRHADRYAQRVVSMGDKAAGIAFIQHLIFDFITGLTPPIQALDLNIFSKHPIELQM